MDRAGIAPGMTVADIGAGEGYYTIRLAARVGEQGRVLAEDIFEATRDALAERVSRERLDNVSVRLGEVESVELSRDQGFAVTVYVGHRKGSASSSDTGEASVSAAVEKALAIAPNNTQIQQNYDLFKEINDRTPGNKDR